MTSFLSQECFSPQWTQDTVPDFTLAAAKESSSITTPVTLSFFVTGHRTRIRLITPPSSHIGGQKLAQSWRTCVNGICKAKPITTNKFQ